ncbi:MAG: PilZ domain-containing protein [Candidatus Omnitrophota bacterium]
MLIAKTKKEKRKSQRLSICFPVKYKLKQHTPLRNAIVCRDISGHGVSILAHEVLKTNHKLNVMLYPKGSCKPIDALCKVVWCRQSYKGAFEAGLEFLKIKQEQQFIDFLCSNLIESSLKK